MPTPGIRLVIIHINKNPLTIKKPNGVDPLHLLQSSTIYMFYIFYSGWILAGDGLGGVEPKFISAALAL